MKKEIKSYIKKLILRRIGSLNSENDARLLQDIKSGNALISYSQQGEDLELLRIFEGQEMGFYIDVGAFHPIAYSNTYNFYLKGWRGINIEPNIDSFKEFEKYRANDVNINCAIGQAESELIYYKFNVPALNTFSKEHRDEWAVKKGFEVIEELQVLQYRLENVLQSNLDSNISIDFMSVDVEGLDLEVLKSNNWGKYRPKILLVEESFYKSDCFTGSPIFTYLKSKNYNLICICGGTSIYASAEKINAQQQ